MIRDKKCPHCPKSFGETSLYKHIKAVHNKIKDEKCQLCDYSSSSKGSLQSHIRHIHLHKRTLPCNECSKTFSTQQKLEDHKKSVHRKEKDLLCMECNKAFSIRDNLVKHIKGVHNKIRRKEKCNICDTELSSKQSLSYHIISKHGEEQDIQA